MDWQVVSAVGSVLCALATFLAAVIALHFGLRDGRNTVYVRGLFRNCERYEELPNHPNAFEFECLNTGRQNVYLWCVIEKPHYSVNIKGVVSWLRSFQRKELKVFGAAAPDYEVRRFWAAHPLGDNICLAPGQLAKFVIPFSVLQTDQKERHAYGGFSSSKKLSFYVVDITGKKYTVKAGARPNSFLSERTCHLNPVSRITWNPVIDPLDSQSKR